MVFTTFHTSGNTFRLNGLIIIYPHKKEKTYEKEYLHFIYSIIYYP